MILDITDDYRYVLLTASLICFHITITGFIAGGKRSKAFSKDFMEENFKTEHERFFPGQAVPKGGYPDMGNGRYSAKLSYKEWFEFNNLQRIHYNYLESVACIIIWLLIGGLAPNFTWAAVGLGGANLVGRVIYHVGYSMKGPKGRVAGFIIVFLTSFALFIISILSPLRLLNYF